MKTSEDEFNRGGGGSPPCAGVIPNALPEVQTPSEEVNSKTGVSTRNAPIKTIKRKTNPDTIPLWYAIRCTYGREKKAHDFFSTKGIKAYYPTITTAKVIEGKVKMIEESRLPNILFAFASFEELKVFVYDNQDDDTKYLRFYYNYHHDGSKEPLTVPQRQMSSLMKICDADADDKLLDPFVVDKFKQGQLVRVTDGPFKGVEGVIKRYKGQQRVGIVFDGLFTVTTAYISTNLVEVIDL